MTKEYKYVRYYEPDIAILQKYRIKQWDWLLIIGSILAPMTGLRITKVGPAELLCFIWALRYLSPGLHRNAFTGFFTVFFSSMLIGTLICLVVAPNELVMSSWLSWIFLGYIACTLSGVICNNDLLYNEKILDLISHLSIIWYLFLYILAETGRRSFMGAPLWYYERFTGGGTNPHQLAVMCCGFCFLFLRQIRWRKGFIWNAASFIISIYLVYKTESSTGLAAIFAGMITFIFVYTISNIYDRRKRAILLSIEAMATIVIIILFYNTIYLLLYDWVASDANGLGRFYLWASVKQMAIKSPIFGLGPGVHAITAGGNIKEFHNSFIDIYAASGIFGFIALIIFSLKYFFNIKEGDLYLLPIMASMYMYSIAGFAFRRLAFWVIVSFTYTIAMQLRYEKQ